MNKWQSKEEIPHFKSKLKTYVFKYRFQELTFIEILFFHFFIVYNRVSIVQNFEPLYMRYTNVYYYYYCYYFVTVLFLLMDHKNIFQLALILVTNYYQSNVIFLSIWLQEKSFNFVSID